MLIGAFAMPEDIFEGRKLMSLLHSEFRCCMGSLADSRDARSTYLTQNKTPLGLGHPWNPLKCKTMYNRYNHVTLMYTPKN